MTNILYILTCIFCVLLFIRNMLKHHFAKHPPKDQTINNLFYSLCLISPSTRDTFRRLYKFNLYKERDLKIKVMLEYGKWFAIGTALVIFVLLFTQDLYFSLLYVAVAVVFVIDKMADIVNKEFLKFTNILPSYLQRLIDEYNASRDVNKSLEDVYPPTYLYRYSLDLIAISKHDRVGDLLYTKLIDKGFYLNTIVYNIVYKVSQLGGSFTGKRLSETPFPVCLTAAIKQIRKENNIASERKSQIASLKVVALISPIIFIFLNNTIDTSFVMITHMYYGVYGAVVKIVYIIVFCVIYLLFSKESDLMYSLGYDRSEVIDWLYKRLKVFIDTIKPHNTKKLQLRLDLCKSYKTPEVLTTERVAFSVVMYLLVSILITVALFFSRLGIRSSMSSFGLSGNVGYATEYKEFYLDTDYYFLDMDDEEYDELTSEQLAQVYMANVPRMTQYYANVNAERIKAKRVAYKSATLPWWFFIIFLLAAGVSWFIPDVILKFRRNGFLRVRGYDITLILHSLVLFSFTTESAFNILSLLAKSVNVLGTELYYVREISSTETEQFISRQKYVNDDLAQIYSKMYYVSSKLLPEEAFDSMKDTVENEIEKSKIREQDEISRKRSAFLMISLLPLFIAIFLILVIPLMVSSMSALNDVFESFNNK